MPDATRIFHRPSGGLRRAFTWLVVGGLAVAFGRKLLLLLPLLPEARIAILGGAAGVVLLMVVTNLFGRVVVEVDEERLGVRHRPVPVFGVELDRDSILGFVTHRRAIVRWYQEQENHVPHYVWDVQAHLRSGELVPVVVGMEFGEEAADLRRRLDALVLDGHRPKSRWFAHGRW